MLLLLETLGVIVALIFIFGRVSVFTAALGGIFVLLALIQIAFPWAIGLLICVAISRTFESPMPYGGDNSFEIFTWAAVLWTAAYVIWCVRQWNRIPKTSKKG